MVGFVHQRARQQFFSAYLDGFTFHVLRARGNRAWPRHLLAEFGQTQAALGREVGFPRADDLRVHEGLVPVGDEKPGVDADLRGRQTIFSRS